MNEIKSRLAQHLVRRLGAEKLQTRIVGKYDPIGPVDENGIRRKLDQTAVATFAFHQGLLRAMVLVFGGANLTFKPSGIFIDLPLGQGEIRLALLKFLIRADNIFKGGDEQIQDLL